MKSRGNASKRPSKSDVIPDWLYDSNPELFSNVTGGAQMTYSAPYGTLASFPANPGTNGYDVMQMYTDDLARRFNEKRVARRILQGTPVNRFIFELHGGRRAYEVMLDASSNTWHVIPSFRDWANSKTFPVWGKGKYR